MASYFLYNLSTDALDVGHFLLKLEYLQGLLAHNDWIVVKWAVNWTSGASVGSLSTAALPLHVILGTSVFSDTTSLNAAFTLFGSSILGSVNSGLVTFTYSPPADQEVLPPFNITTKQFDDSSAPYFEASNYSYTKTIVISNLSNFWTAARDLTVPISTLWANYAAQMSEIAPDVLRYRELATRAADNYNLTLSGSIGGSELVSIDTLDQIAADILSGHTRDQLLTTYGGAVVAYGRHIQGLVEGNFLTPSQQSDTFATLYQAMQDGDTYSSLLATYGSMLVQNPMGFVVLDRFAKSGIYPR